MRYLRRRLLHVITAFLLVYIAAVYYFTRRSWPKHKSHVGDESFSPEVEYDFEQAVKAWHDETRLPPLSDGAKAGREDEKMDWHDLNLMEKEKFRQGDGEHGAPVNVSLDQQAAVPDRFKDIGYNVAASLRVSLDRAVPDLRHPSCYTRLYRKHLLPVSFIIPFHNELNVTLLRTVHSVIKRSPRELLKEIILVDDASTDQELMEPLDKYLNSTFPDMQVKIVRIPVKQGLMNARSLGATHAQGDILIFFDAHIEVGVNYLPPLIEPIVENYKTIANPIVGVIDNKDFRIYSGTLYAGGVNFKMNYTYIDVNPKYSAKPTAPYPNPVMIGCAFAISKRWWKELEGYDPMLRMWGSEQFELSLKTWMCGGSQVNVPCSRIAHLFRPRREGDSDEDRIARENNMHRVALAWMDDYVDYVYITYERLLKINPGDVSPQMRLRRKLKCKSYDWFMRNVQPEILRMEQLPKRPYVAWGRISTRHDGGAGKSCIRVRETMGIPEFILTDCQWGDDGLMPEHFHYTIQGFLSTTVRKPSACLAPGALQHQIGLAECLSQDTRQIWAYNSVSGHFTNLVSKLCMEKALFNASVRLRPCDDKSISQSWDIEFLDPNVKFY